MSSHQCQLQVSEKEQNHGVLDLSSMEVANNSHAFTRQKFLHKQSRCNVVVEAPTSSVLLLKLFFPYTSPDTEECLCRNGGSQFDPVAAFRTFSFSMDILNVQHPQNMSLHV